MPMIRLTIPSIEDDDLAAVREVLASGYLVQGRHVAAFEEAVAACVGVPHAIAVSNCTAALHLSLLALGVGPGDSVAVTAYSFTATANVIELCGAKPLFVDIRPDTFNMDPARLAEALAREPAGRVKAIIPVHTFGQMADMPAILAVAAKHGVPVIEDAACALGAALACAEPAGGEGAQRAETGNRKSEIGNAACRPAGAWGLMGCFSFHPRKAITTGEGGMVVTRDAGLAAKLRALRNHGQDPAAPSPDFILPGFNYRMTDLQGALGVTQMAKLPRVISARRERAAVYDRLLAAFGPKSQAANRNSQEGSHAEGAEGQSQQRKEKSEIGNRKSEMGAIQPPAVAPGARHVYQSYVVLLPREAAGRRDDIIAALKAQGIETTIGTWHIPMLSYYRRTYGYREGDFPVADDIFARALTLPLHERLGGEDQARVLDSLCACLAET